MFKKLLSLVLVGLLMQFSFAPHAIASTLSEKEARLIEKVKNSIAEIGTGAAARIRVKLKDGTSLTGYVSEASADRFTIVESKTGATRAVAYPQVAQVKGKNHLSGKTIAITAIVVAAFVIPLVIFAKRGGGA